MRILSYLTTFLVAVLLAACGGGGGSPGLSSGSVSALSVAAPAAVTLQVGSTQQYTVQGGVKPYVVFSSDPSVAVGWLVGENVFSIGTIVAGKATVTLQDAKGTKFDIALVAGSNTAFFTSMPPLLKIAPGTFGTHTFILGGGVPPYKAVSEVPAAVSVSVNGTVLTDTALLSKADPLQPLSSIVTLTDSAQQQAVIASSVQTAAVLLSVAPDAMTVALGDVIRAIITGGTPPYRLLVGIDDTILSPKIVNGNQLEGVAGQVAAGAGIRIIDSNGIQVGVTVTISNIADVLRVSPGVLSIPESASTPSLSLSVFGVSSSGGIQVFSSDNNFLKPGTPVKNAAGTGYDIPLTGGNTCSATVAPAVAPVVGPPFVPGTPAAGGDRVITITVLDAKGSTGTSTITIKDNNGVAGC